MEIKTSNSDIVPLGRSIAITVWARLSALAYGCKPGSVLQPPPTLHLIHLWTIVTVMVRAPLDLEECMAFLSTMPLMMDLKGSVTDSVNLEV